MALQQCRHQLQINTSGQGFTRLDDRINQWLGSTGVLDGALHLTCLHTSASLTINENADSTVREDFEAHFNEMVPEGQTYYHHTMEGPDDMPAHIKSSLLGSSLSIPINNGRVVLGTWQGIYLCEHRNNGGQRSIVITVNGG